MIRAGVLLATAAALGATAGCNITGSDLDGIREVVRQIEALPGIDIGNCEHNHPSFDTALKAFQKTATFKQFQRLLDHHEIALANPVGSADEYSKQTCLQALASVQAILKQHRPVIERLAKTLPTGQPG